MPNTSAQVASGDTETFNSDMQEFPSRPDMASASPWGYTQVGQPATLKQETLQSSRNGRPSDESQMWQTPLSTESLSAPQNEVSLPEMVAHLEVALRASERAREEGCNESSALRRYLSEVEVAAAGLVARVHDLEHLLTLSTASHENKDLDQLRGQMLLVTARDARQHAIAAAQAISTARQATMQLDQVKREASALTASQEEEIKKLSVDLNHCHDLLQRKDSLLKEKEREEERLNEAEEKATRFQDLLDSLEFSRASARASEHHLQEARIQKKDTAIQNELLQHKVAELESREVQTTIAHYDLELCKVRTLLEGEKTHLLMELAKLRQGNRSLKGEVAEWRGRYNTVLKQTNLKSGEDLVPTTFEPAEISCAKLRKFFSVDCFDDETYLVPDSTKRMSKEENICSGMAPTNEVTNRSELQNTQDGPHNYIVRYDEGRLDTKDCLRGGEHSTQEKMNGWRVKTQDRKENGDDLLLLSDRIEDGRYRNSEWGGSSCTDNQLRLIENMEYQNGRVRLDDRRELDDDEVCTSGRQLEPELQATNTVVTREKSFDYGSLSAAEAKTKNERKLRSVSFLDQLMYGPDNGTLALQDETCFEMGENLLSVAHRELVKLKRGKRGDSGCIPFSASLRLFGPIIFFLLQVVSRQASRKRSNMERDFNDMIYEGLKYLESRLD
ncbi:hypothetical protein MPTK1_5g21160 [Marchantia polymorpha subsp. ruderalis]|uniref:Uncharacterized protein n=2 Tax=Marchantia polymorpha TaxID=3197 RepID=A0AAF6BKN4_MARPO|nr:hypothetical protein MARPO_0058s0098 [Marchantia polymorpha]BBN12568.1 hypothetical protein Mp_5g21160 [Marchantia polymorpha subsp. ruderalis]|eukprot:PTQ37328.1 hypothetical protein MARPO_0058s0098 [Marchantia polymorpha]